MTGHEHNARQIRNRSTAIAFAGCIAIASLLLNIAIQPTGKVLAVLSIICLAAIAFTVVVLRQKCPFCHLTLTVDSKTTHYGEYCRHCGAKFSSEVQKAVHTGQFRK